MKPLVSVVITTYAGVNVIERAIKSVINQTYENIEIIVVDDNGVGTKNQIATKAIVDSYGNKVNYIAHETNKNGSVARNTGIKAASGIYVALLDDDDVFRKDKIETQVQLLENKGDEYALCYTGMLIHYQNGKEDTIISEEEGEIFKSAILRKVHAQTSGFLIRREAALKIGGFDESFLRHQDWEFFDRMSYYYKVAVVPHVYVDRYIYKRTSAKSPKQFENNRIYYLKKMQKFINKLEPTEKKYLYSFHYRSISREYLKNKNLVKGLYYFIKCGNPLETIIQLWKDYRSSSRT